MPLSRARPDLARQPDLLGAASFGRAGRTEYLPNASPMTMLGKCALHWPIEQKRAVCRSMRCALCTATWLTPAQLGQPAATRAALIAGAVFWIAAMFTTVRDCVYVSSCACANGRRASHLGTRWAPISTSGTDSALVWPTHGNLEARPATIWHEIITIARRLLVDLRDEYGTKS